MTTKTPWTPGISPGKVPGSAKTPWVPGIISRKPAPTKSPWVVAVAPGKLNKSAALQFAVVDITFGNGIDIWYARIPTSGGNVGWLQTAPVPLSPPSGSPPPPQPGDLVTPAEVRPISGQPHYKPTAGSRTESWPVAYFRGPQENLARTVTARFQCLSPSGANGSFKVVGKGPGSMVTDSQNVQFTNGIGSATFTLKSVPTTVKRLNQASLVWTFLPSVGIKPLTAACTSEHTFYFVDAAPLTPLGGSIEKLFFELFDWSCRWADGKTGQGPVVAAIWKKFSPIRIPHDSGFIYWRNSPIGVQPAQNMADGIRSVDPGKLNAQFAVSCKVFDRMFTNTLALHGIQSSEVMLTPNAASFQRGVVKYVTPASWGIANAAAQGNPAGPRAWNSHWIADVHINGTWELYDPSYGAKTSPWIASPAPMGKILPPATYESGAGVFFNAKPNVGGGASVSFHSANPDDPRLSGQILFAN